MIIAAAIRFHIDKSDKDVTLCGNSHANIFKQLSDLGFKPKEGYKELEQGFIDETGKFYNRKDAYIHAVKSCQLEMDFDPKSSDELFSEDLFADETHRKDVTIPILDFQHCIDDNKERRKLSNFIMNTNRMLGDYSFDESSRLNNFGGVDHSLYIYLRFDSSTSHY